ncbi:GNAT family N-acetyltransferase [Paenibacillus sp. GCM10012307]|uniref:GNAT family N-acetyltransferase n=1 Tax=Paenibacillus roseus TaxID=2798579 RepID=A0A934MM34_9BACL|nr:GNAT family N-acetyltransferase [Paenibacillus roseus]MBJ6362875.1 GNAT family N-acetyltransferase [Paenibacillus roseus]
MKLNIYNDCLNRDWERVAQIMNYFGLSDALDQAHKQAFENSYVVTFVYDDETLIGFGRAISDGVSQAAIYNIAVAPEYHNQGIGRLIIEDLLKFVKHCTVVLYTHPDKVNFYKRLGFRRMKTGMAIYRNEDKLEEMGFIE